MLQKTQWCADCGMGSARRGYAEKELLAPQHPRRGGLPLGAPRGWCSQAGYAGAMICREPRPELAHNAPNGAFKCQWQVRKWLSSETERRTNYVANDEF